MDNATINLRVPQLLQEQGKSTIEMMYGARLSQGTAYNLARGVNKGISFDVLASLCVFFKCQPNDLLELAIPGESPIDGQA